MTSSGRAAEDCLSSSKGRYVEQRGTACCNVRMHVKQRQERVLSSGITLTKAEHFDNFDAG